MTGSDLQFQRKIVSLQEMSAKSGLIKHKGSTVVLTNGCFDLLHRGHVTYLQEARRLGDMLCVGINSDDSVRAIKGLRRPLNPEQDRAALVAALGSVSLVTIFGEPDAIELVRAIRPAIYVKGGDYSPDPESPKFPIEGTLVTDYGGIVQIVPLISGYSTTDLIANIERLHDR